MPSTEREASLAVTRPGLLPAATISASSSLAPNPPAGAWTQDADPDLAPLAPARNNGNTYDSPAEIPYTARRRPGRQSLPRGAVQPQCPQPQVSSPAPTIVFNSSAPEPISRTAAAPHLNKSLTDASLVTHTIRNARLEVIGYIEVSGSHEILLDPRHHALGAYDRHTGVTRDRFGKIVGIYLNQLLALL